MHVLQKWKDVTKGNALLIIQKEKNGHWVPHLFGYDYLFYFSQTQAKSQGKLRPVSRNAKK
jgi:hypothetical protein